MINEFVSGLDCMRLSVFVRKTSTLLQKLCHSMPRIFGSCQTVANPFLSINLTNLIDAKHDPLSLTIEFLLARLSIQENIP